MEHSMVLFEEFNEIELNFRSIQNYNIIEKATAACSNATNIGSRITN